MNDKENQSFLGTGWSFPPRFVKDTQTLAMVSGEDDIRESLKILFHTSLGERFLSPTYGCDLKSYIFEPLTSALESKLQDLITSAVLYHEPRIQPENIKLHRYPEEGRLEIEFTYMIISTNSRRNVVFPFYLNEGTDI